MENNDPLLKKVEETLDLLDQMRPTGNFPDISEGVFQKWQDPDWRPKAPQTLQGTGIRIAAMATLIVLNGWMTLQELTRGQDQVKTSDAQVSEDNYLPIVNEEYLN